MDMIHELAARLTHLKRERQGHENTWQDIYDHGWPFRGDITTQRNPGESRMVGVFDTTMMMAAVDLANFLKSQILPTSTAWLRLEPPRELRGDLALRQALDATSDRVHEALHHSNFYVEAGGSMRDFVFIGNQCLSARELDPRLNRDGSTFGGLAFKCISMKRVWWKFGNNPRQFMVVREIEMPALDAYRFFEGKPGAEASALIEEGKAMEMVKYHHFVYRNEKGVPGGLKNPMDRPWISVYLSCDKDRPEAVGNGGFDECPYICSRWMVVDGEEYGRGPGHIARPDAKGVNELRRKVLEAADYDLDPPLMVESENIVDIDVGSGGQVVVKPSLQRDPSYLNSGARYDVANQIGMEDRDQIRKAFLGDALRGKDTQPRSALESQIEMQRQMRLFAAPADVIITEFLNPLVDVVLDKMVKGNALPEIVDAARRLGPLALRPTFVSPFFTAQKAAQVERVMAFLQRRVELFQATQDPNYLIDIDPQKVTQYDSIEADVPSDIFRSLEEVEQLKQAQAEEAQRQAALQTLQGLQRAGVPQRQLATGEGV